jgi:hypothetical protein
MFKNVNLAETSLTALLPSSLLVDYVVIFLPSSSHKKARRLNLLSRSNMSLLLLGQVTPQSRKGRIGKDVVGRQRLYLVAPGALGWSGSVGQQGTSFIRAWLG